MIGLVLVTHGQLAAEFVRAMEHVVGKQERIATVCIGPDDDMEARRQDIASAIAERHGTSVATVAVAWTLAWPGVTGAIVGARSPAQVDGWIDAARLDLTAADLAEIAAAIAATGAGTGPRSPSEV